MMSPLARAVLVISIAPACTQDNPLFGLTGEGDATTMGSASTTASPVSTTASATTGEPVTTTAQPGTSDSVGETGPPPTTTSDSEPDTTATTATTATTEPQGSAATTDEPLPDSSSTGTGDTGEALGDSPLEIPAMIATCVLLPVPPPFAGPDQCEKIGNAIDGGPSPGIMMLDTGVMLDEGGGRPAVIFLRFVIPAALAEKALGTATLSIHVSDKQAIVPGLAGDLRRVTPFSDDDLDGFPTPAPLAPLKLNNQPVTAGQPTFWEFSTDQITPGEDLHLGLYPLNNDGIPYRSSSSTLPDLRPHLTITYQ